MSRKTRHKIPLSPKVFAQRNLIIVGIAATAALLIQDQIAANSFKIHTLEQTQQQLKLQQEQLTIKLAQLSSPENLYQKAEQLGMVPAEKIAGLNIKKKKISGPYTLTLPADYM